MKSISLEWNFFFFLFCAKHFLPIEKHSKQSAKSFRSEKYNNKNITAANLTTNVPDRRLTAFHPAKMTRSLEATR